MKKYLNLFALATLLITGNLALNNLMKTPVSESGIDYLADVSGTRLNKGLRVGEDDVVSSSKMFVQYGKVEGENPYYVMRFAVAVKGNINSLVYSRASINGLNDVLPYEVTTVYESISANGETYYYNPTASETGLTTDDTYKGSYYWTVYSIGFTSGETHWKTEFDVSLKINDELTVSRKTSLYEQLLNENPCLEGHDMVNYSDDSKAKCSRCDTYSRIYDLNDARSNAWLGEEYNDQLCKCADGAAYKGNYVGRVTDVASDPNLAGKVYLEFDAYANKNADARIDFGIGLPTGETDKIRFTVLINGQEVTHDGGKLSTNNPGWTTFNSVYYADAKLSHGYNTVRIYINEGACCNLDYIKLTTTANLTEDHSFSLVSNDEEHFYKCNSCEETYGHSAHVYDREVETDEYKTSENTYYKSCSCGKAGTETFEVHVHSYHQEIAGFNDVMVCDCGAMKRKFDLATSFSESWSEGTAKTDALWRQLGSSPRSSLDSGNWISHINDVVYDGQHDGQYWMEIGVTFEGTEDIEVELILNAGVSDRKNWNVMDFIVNGTEIENNGSFEGYGWNAYTDYTFGKITLKAGQLNTIRISPNNGCSMNWCYLQINSEIPTVNATQTLIDQARG